MRKTIYRTIGVPSLGDMKILLQIACQTCDMDRSQRAGHVLRELNRLLNASCSTTWIIDEKGHVIQNIIAGNRKSKHLPSDDIAVDLIARTTRKKMPIIKSRSELINHATWSRASADWMKGIANSIYSLQKIDQQHRSLIAIYGPVMHSDPWTHRAIQLTRLIHSQTAMCFCTKRANDPVNT